MGKDPAFLFYPGDWLCGTMHMQRISRACYFDLLMLQFSRGAFTLPEAKECLGSDFDKWEIIKDKFIEDNSMFYNARMREEIEKRKRYTESKKAGAYAMHMHKHTENENRNENKDVILLEKKEKDCQGKEGKEVKEKPLWKTSFPEYERQAGEAFDRLTNDADFLSWRKKYHPNLDIYLSLEKSFNDFWGQEAGWEHKKKQKSDKINWEATFKNALTLKSNQVWEKK